MKRNDNLRAEGHCTSAGFVLELDYCEKAENCQGAQSNKYKLNNWICCLIVICLLDAQNIWTLETILAHESLKEHIKTYRGLQYLQH